MPATGRIAAAVAIAILVVAMRGSVQAGFNGRVEYWQERDGNALSGAYAAASKSSRTTRPAQRARVSRPADASPGHVLTTDGRDLGTDPDAAIRFQLLRDNSSGRM